MISLMFFESVNDKIISRYIKKITMANVIFIFTLFFYKNRKDLLIKSIEYALWVFFGLLLMQLVLYYILGEYIDLLYPLTGAEQRYHVYFVKSAIGLDLIRPTSLFSEPGTYAVNTLPLLILSYISRRKIILLHKLLLGSYFATLSLFAIIIAVLFIIIVSVSKFELKLTIKNVASIFLFLLMFITIGIAVGQYLQFRFIAEGNTDAIGSRESIISYWLNLDSIGIIFGQGFAQGKFSNFTIDDASFAFKLIYEYGILSIPMFLLMIYISWGFPLYFFGIILLTKVNYMIYIFWFYFAALYIIHKKDSRL